MTEQLQKINELLEAADQEDRDLGMRLLRQVQWSRSDSKPLFPATDKVYTVTLFNTPWLPQPYLTEKNVVCHCISDSIAWFTVYPDRNVKNSFECHLVNIIDFDEYTLI